jgi:cytochrome b
VLAMLLFLSLQVATGLFSDDEISNAGPLTSLVSERLVGMATQWHKSFGKLIIFFLVITHVLAIAWYFFKKKNNLIKAMVDGNKLSPEPAQSSNDQPRDWLKALVILLFCAGLVYALIQSGAAPMLSALN